MADATTAENNFNIDGMLTGFFANVSQRAFGGAGTDISQRAFGRMNKGVEVLESKFKQLQNVAQSSYDVMRAGTNRAIDATESLTRKLREQANTLRNMPRMKPPQTPSGGQPRGDDGRYQPTGRGGRGTRFGGRFSPGSGGLGGISAFGGLGSVGALFAGASVARGFGQFDANLATIQAEAGLDKTQRKDVTGQILDLAGSTQFNTDEISSALIQMIRDGVKLKDALAEVPNVLKLAVAEGKDLTTAWNATNTIVSGLNLPLSESARLMDMMSNATSLSKLQLEQIQYIAGQSLSLYSQISGFSEEGFFGISGILGPLFRPERIGTGLKQLSLLLPQAARGELAGSKNEVFQNWGVNITDAAGNLKDEVTVLKEFERVFAGMSGEARNVELAKVFGTEAAPVFSALIGQSAKLAENMEAIRKKGTLDKKFSVHAESLANKWKLLTSAGDSLIKKFVMILNEGEAFGGGIGWVTEKITQLTGFMESNKDSIQQWWGNFQEILGGLFNLVETGVEKFAKFWGGLSEGQRTVLAIGAVIGAFLIGPVTGIIAAGALIVAKWHPIRNFFVALWNDVTWETFEAWDNITGFASSAWEKIKGFFSGVGSFFSGVWGAITGTAATAWEKITGLFSGVWDALTSPVKSTVDFVRGHWGLLEKIFAWSPYGIILKAFKPAIDFFVGLAGKLKAPLEAVFDYIKGKFDWLKGAVTDLLNWLPGVSIGGEGQERKPLPEIKRIEGETDQMYKFRQMQEAARLRSIEEQDVLRLRTIEEEDDKRDKVHEQAIKRQRRLRAGTTSMGGFEQYERFTAMMKPPKSKEVTKSTESYETRAAKPVTAPVIEKPKWGFDDFVEAFEKEAKTHEAIRKSFGVRTALPIVGTTRNIEEIYKLDDRAMSNVRKSFEETAEKDFFSGLESYAEQSFSHIDSILTEAHQSTRQKVFETQKFLKEDAKKWKEIMESGAFDRLSASMSAAGESTKYQEAYDTFMGKNPSAFDADLDATKRREKYVKGFESLKDSIPANLYNALKDNFGLLVEKAPYSPLVKKLTGMIDLTETNQNALKTAERQRGFELLSGVWKTSDTVTQAEKRLSETDAGLLRNMFDELKEFAPQLPMMQSLMARESMLTGEPRGTKMNVFEFPTLTKEQHIELTDVFRSHFLTLADINSAQLATLQQIARLLGVQNVAGTLGGGNFANVSGPAVIKEQHSTLSDDYLAYRHRQTFKQVSGNLNDNMPQAPPVAKIPKAGPQFEPHVIGPPQLSDIQVQRQVFGPHIDIQSPNIDATASRPEITDVAAPQSPDIRPQADGISKQLSGIQAMTGVLAKDSPQPELRPVVNIEAMQPASLESVFLREQNTTPVVAFQPLPQPAPIKDRPLPEVSEVSPVESLVNPTITIEPLITPEQPIMAPQIEDIVAPDVPVIHSNFVDAAAPNVPVIRPEFDPRFDDFVDRFPDEARGGRGRGGEMSVSEAASRRGENRIVINNPQFIINGVDKDAKELAAEVYEELWGMIEKGLQEEERKNQF